MPSVTLTNKPVYRSNIRCHFYFSTKPNSLKHLSQSDGIRKMTAAINKGSDTNILTDIALSS